MLRAVQARARSTKQILVMARDSASIKGSPLANPVTAVPMVLVPIPVPRTRTVWTRFTARRVVVWPIWPSAALVPATSNARVTIASIRCAVTCLVMASASGVPARSKAVGTTASVAPLPPILTQTMSAPTNRHPSVVSLVNVVARVVARYTRRARCVPLSIAPPIARKTSPTLAMALVSVSIRAPRRASPGIAATKEVVRHRAKAMQIASVPIIVRTKTAWLTSCQVARVLGTNNA